MNFETGTIDPGLVAFYYPQFHPIPLNDKMYGEGHTEWENVDRGKPLFKGHRQPRVSNELGQYDLMAEDLYPRQVEMARQAGVSGFCFYYYWFTGGRRLLERPLNRMLESNTDFPFCLMWANHDWNMAWRGDRHKKTLEMTYAAQDPADFIEDAARALSDDRYIRVDGKPLLMIYELDGPYNVDEYVESLREAANARGLGELFIAGVQIRPNSPNRLSEQLDGLCEFPPHGYNEDPFFLDAVPEGIDPRFAGKLLDYDKMAVGSLLGRNLWPTIKYFRTAVPDWDNTARRIERVDPIIYANATTSAYESWLAGLLHLAANDVDTLPIVFVNAWNEWGEAAYLEPDEHSGRALLDATASAVAKSQTIDNVTSVVREFQPERSKWQPFLSPNAARPAKCSVSVTSGPDRAAFASLRIGTRDMTKNPNMAAIVQQDMVPFEGVLLHESLAVPNDSATAPNVTIVLKGTSDSYSATLVPTRFEAIDGFDHTAWSNDALNMSRFQAHLDLRAIPQGSYRVEVSRGGVNGFFKPVVVITPPLSDAPPFEGEMRDVGFMHIQKTGGTSLVQLARQSGMKPMITHGGFLWQTSETLAATKFLSGHFGVDFLRPYADGRYLFTVLRDPVDRVISLYKFNRRQDPKQWLIFRLCQQLNWAQFIRSQEPLVKEHIDNHMVWSLAVGRGNLEGKMPWDIPIDEQLDMAIANLDLFDEVLLLERGDAEIRMVANSIGLNGTKIPRANANPAPTDMSGMAPANLEHLRSRVAADTELYKHVQRTREEKFPGLVTLSKA